MRHGAEVVNALSWIMLDPSSAEGIKLPSGEVVDLQGKAFKDRFSAACTAKWHRSIFCSGLHQKAEGRQQEQGRSKKQANFIT